MSHLWPSLSSVPRQPHPIPRLLNILPSVCLWRVGQLSLSACQFRGFGHGQCHSWACKVGKCQILPIVESVKPPLGGDGVHQSPLVTLGPGTRISGGKPSLVLKGDKQKGEFSVYSNSSGGPQGNFAHTISHLHASRAPSHLTLPRSILPLLFQLATIIDNAHSGSKSLFFCRSFPFCISSLPMKFQPTLSR